MATLNELLDSVSILCIKAKDEEIDADHAVDLLEDAQTDLGRALSLMEERI